MGIAAWWTQGTLLDRWWTLPPSAVHSPIRDTRPGPGYAARRMSSDRWSRTDLIDADMAPPRYPEVEVTQGMTLTHTASATTGEVSGFSEGDRVVVTDRFGTRQVFRALDGAFTHQGVRVALRAPKQTQPGLTRTASGSLATSDSRAKVARAARIWVEGIHDAELLEKIWGDDLRAAAIVVEPMHGVDGLATDVAAFAPSADRRLGILLDHLVAGSKEMRLAESVTDPHVLVVGHPFVDVWAAIDPSVIGIDAWPVVPPGRPWKEGVLEALGVRGETGLFWGRVLGRVTDWNDVDTTLVNAVERLIDFVTEG